MDAKLIAWLNTQLKQRGWSHRELARRSGLSQTAVSSVISEQRNPGWDFCLAVARALGEPPENVFRMAGLLPALPQPIAQEHELIHLIRSMDDDTRAIVLTMLRNLPIQKGPPPIAEAPAQYSTFTSDLNTEIDDFLDDFPQLSEVITQAREQLSEEAVRALILNIRIFILSKTDRLSFSNFHKQVSDLFQDLVE